MIKIMISIRENGGNGGPHVSHSRIIESNLRNKFILVPLIVPSGRLGIFNLSLTRSLISQIKLHKPDVVQIMGLELIGFHLCLAARLAGCRKIVVAIHGSASESIELNANFLKKRIILILQYLTLKMSKIAYGVSDYISTFEILKKFNEKYYGCIYNITDNRLSKAEKEFNLRNYLKISGNDTLLISVGRIEVEKGYEILAKTIAIDNDKTRKYIIVGDGTYLETMMRNLKQEKNEGRVYFLGFRNDVNILLPQCDIFIMASLHETFCMALAEASWAGLALIASKVGGMKEIISDGINGLLVNEINEKEFMNAINYVADNKERLALMKMASLKIAEEKFDTKKIIARLDELYTRIQ